MLQRFLSTYPVSSGQTVDEEPEPTPHGLRATAGGRTFAGGLYRIHTAQSSERLAQQIAAAFPDASPHTMPYGYDWLGGQFCAVTDDEDAHSLMFEPGTGQVLRIPVPFSLIHDEELVDHGEEALARSFFRAYRAAGGPAPDLTQCVGYRTPLFLGGEDTPPNLELTDMDVYWRLTGQLIRQTTDLPPGTKIGSITHE